MQSRQCAAQHYDREDIIGELVRRSVLPKRTFEGASFRLIRKITGLNAGEYRRNFQPPSSIIEN